MFFFSIVLGNILVIFRGIGFFILLLSVGTYLSTSIGSVDLYRLRFQSCLPQCAEIIM